MERKQYGAVIGIVVLVGLIILGILMGWWSLSSILLNVIPFFIAGIIALFVWGFKEKIDVWSDRNKKTPPLTPSGEFNPPLPRDSISETRPPPKPKQPSIEEGIYRYQKRSDLPFDEVVSKAEKNKHYFLVIKSCFPSRCRSKQIIPWKRKP